MLTVGSLFSGIGGIELGLERTGHFKTIWQVEIDDYCNRVLEKHWPRVRKWKDIRDFNAMLSAGASPVRTYLSRERAPAFGESVLVSGGRCLRPFAWYDPATSSWRTWTRSLTGGWAMFSGPWPKAGTIRNGIAYRRSPLGASTQILKALFGDNGGTVYSLWPTPRAIYGEHPGMKDPEHLTGAVQLWPTPTSRDWKDSGENVDYKAVSQKGKLSGRVKLWPTPKAQNARAPCSHGQGGPDLQTCIAETEKRPGVLNPEFSEWLMGFPIGYTALEPSATPSSPRSRSTSESSSGTTIRGGLSE